MKLTASAIYYTDCDMIEVVTAALGDDGLPVSPRLIETIQIDLLYSGNVVLGSSGALTRQYAAKDLYFRGRFLHPMKQDNLSVRILAVYADGTESTLPCTITKQSENPAFAAMADNTNLG